MSGLLLFLTLNAFAEPQTAGQWCDDAQRSMKRLGWFIDPCRNLTWKVESQSVENRALVYADFGNPQAQNVTLVLATVHGDEITPFYVAVQLALWLKAHEAELNHSRVVVAPLINPDGFFSQPKKRVNSRGIDVNRNFATQDWKTKAIQSWKNRYRSDPRRNPGKEPSSEPETQFQEALIRNLKPHKILSIHSPLNFVDYDGPNQLSLSQFPKEYAKVCDQLRKALKARSGRFYPGSLGNYSGRELGIPTLTLELPSSDARKAHSYWIKFQQGIRTMIQFDLGYANRS